MIEVPNHVVNLSEFKKNPMKAVENTVAVVEKGKPIFYCLPVAVYKQLMDLIEDIEDLEYAQLTGTEKTVKVSISELRSKKFK